MAAMSETKAARQAARQARQSASAPIAFAQRLAHPDKAVRDANIRKLAGFLQRPSPLSSTDLQKLWKGVFYTFWLSDKQAVQAELAERIASMQRRMQAERWEQFVRGFFLMMRREWPGIDRLRLDKYMMLVRLMTRHSLLRLRDSQWADDMTQRWAAVYADGPLHNGQEQRGLFLHVTDVLVPELSSVVASAAVDSPDGLSFALLDRLLSPLYPILTSCADRSMVRRVEEEVMEALYNIAKESHASEQDPLHDLLQQSAGKLATRLFELASDRSTIEKHRPALYRLRDCFQSLHQQLTAASAELPTPSKKRKAVGGILTVNGSSKKAAAAAAGQQEATALPSHHLRGNGRAATIKDLQQDNSAEQQSDAGQKEAIRRRKQEQRMEDGTQEDEKETDAPVFADAADSDAGDEEEDADAAAGQPVDEEADTEEEDEGEDEQRAEDEDDDMRLIMEAEAAGDEEEREAEDDEQAEEGDGDSDSLFMDAAAFEHLMAEEAQRQQRRQSGRERKSRAAVTVRTGRSGLRLQEEKEEEAAADERRQAEEQLRLQAEVKQEEKEEETLSTAGAVSETTAEDSSDRRKRKRKRKRKSSNEAMSGETADDVAVQGDGQRSAQAEQKQRGDSSSRRHKKLKQRQQEEKTEAAGAPDSALPSSPPPAASTSTTLTVSSTLLISPPQSSAAANGAVLSSPASASVSASPSSSRTPKSVRINLAVNQVQEFHHWKRLQVRQQAEEMLSKPSPSRPAIKRRLSGHGSEQQAAEGGERGAEQQQQQQRAAGQRSRLSLPSLSSLSMLKSSALPLLSPRRRPTAADFF